MATGKLNGTKVLLYSNGNAIAYSNSASIAFSMDTIETSTKDSNDWSEFLAGRRSSTFSVDGLVALDSSYNVSYLFGLINAQTTVTLRFSTEVTGDKYYQASAVVTSLDISAANNEAVSFSASFQGTGPVSEVTLT